MEKCVLGLADIDESRVHSLNDALNLSHVDGADVALLIGDFEKQLS